MKIVTGNANFGLINYNIVAIISNKKFKILYQIYMYQALGFEFLRGQINIC